MEYKSLEDIIVKMPVFDSFAIQSNQLSSETFAELDENVKDILKILFHTNKVRIKCIECDEECPFSVSFSIKRNGKSGKYEYSYLGISSGEIDISDNKALFSSVIFPKYDEGIIEYTFTCTMNSYHYQKMYILFTINDKVLTFRKIGQKPLNIDLQRRYSNEYKNILNKYKAFDDFRHFEQSESRGLLAGSCTYLRRVLEKMVATMLQDPNISEEQRNNAEHFVDKIALVENKFDEDIRDVLNSSYSLLSKGIHELNNDEINTFYSLMAEVIFTQLEYEQAAEIKAKKKKELRNNITTAAGRYKK